MSFADEPDLDAVATDEEPPEEEIERDIPDPRTWAANIVIAQHIEDIEATERFRKALQGISEMDAGPMYGQVMSILTAAARQARIDLTGALARVLELEEPPEGTVTVFEAAGRARAYGAEKPPAPTM